MKETAYAKVNLALHVRRRRDDGYHDLETLFAFVDRGDSLTVVSAPQDKLVAEGEFAAAMGDPASNIVLSALARLSHGAGWAVTIDKLLPVAAGLGGGSADAGAVFRLIERAHGLPEDWRDIAVRLGADVPACVASQPCIGRGTGTALDTIANSLRGTPVLLVNPRQMLPTAPVFAGWNGNDRGPLPEGDMLRITIEGRNDLETSAIALCPEIGIVLDVLQRTGALVARMSGSGATCFALYQRQDLLEEARRAIAADNPGWWTMTGALR